MGLEAICFPILMTMSESSSQSLFPGVNWAQIPPIITSARKICTFTVGINASLRPYSRQTFSDCDFDPSCLFV